MNLVEDQNQYEQAVQNLKKWKKTQERNSQERDEYNENLDKICRQQESVRTRLNSSIQDEIDCNQRLQQILEEEQKLEKELKDPKPKLQRQQSSSDDLDPAKLHLAKVYHVENCKKLKGLLHIFERDN